MAGVTGIRENCQIPDQITSNLAYRILYSIVTFGSDGWKIMTSIDILSIVPLHLFFFSILS